MRRSSASAARLPLRRTAVRRPGIPLPIGKGLVAVPSAGFTQEPPTVKGLGPNPPNGIPFVAGKADLPTTLDYAVRVTQREHPHFAFDIGIGQVAGNIGNVVVPTGLPAPYPAYVFPPVNLEARHVVGLASASALKASLEPSQKKRTS